MIPKNSDFAITVEQQPGLTYKITDNNEISGYVSDIESVKQAIFFILNVERYKYLIYSWNYGFEVTDLIGKPKSFVYPELKRRIKEALTQDDRIERVSNFKFSDNKTSVTATFTAYTIYGEVQEEVSINV